jgi:hypothetical protein
MTLPVKFGNVYYYRIAGSYIFAGDLFITRGSLYFFPEIDLEEQRNKTAQYAASLVKGMGFWLRESCTSLNASVLIGRERNSGKQA